jgi:hypothetical protein
MEPLAAVLLVDFIGNAIGSIWKAVAMTVKVIGQVSYLVTMLSCLSVSSRASRKAYQAFPKVRPRSECDTAGY